MRRAAWVLLPVLLAACASGPPAPSRPQQELPAAWPGGSTEPAEQLATRWWLPSPPQPADWYSRER